VCVCVCVCVWGHTVGRVTSACTCKIWHAHIHKQHQLHLSLTWESLMTEAEKPKEEKKKKESSSRLPPFIFLFFHLSPSLDRTLRHQCSIWSTQDRLFKNSSWPGTQSIRPLDAFLLAHQLYTLMSVIWRRGWNILSKNILHYLCTYNMSWKQSNQISSVSCAVASICAHTGSLLTLVLSLMKSPLCIPQLWLLYCVPPACIQSSDNMRTKLRPTPPSSQRGSRLICPRLNQIQQRKAKVNLAPGGNCAADKDEQIRRRGTCTVKVTSVGLCVGSFDTGSVWLTCGRHLPLKCDHLCLHLQQQSNLLMSCFNLLSSYNTYWADSITAAKTALIYWSFLTKFAF